MLFGNKESFAIECIIDAAAQFRHYTRGTISLWFGNQQIGNGNETVALDIPVAELKNITNKQNIRRDVSAEFLDKDTDEILNEVYDHIYSYDVDEQELAEIKRISDRYSVIQMITPSLTGPPFDGWLVLIIDLPKHERIVWRKWISEWEEFESHACLIEEGEYERVVGVFTNWYNHCKNRTDKT